MLSVVDIYIYKPGQYVQEVFTFKRIFSCSVSGYQESEIKIPNVTGMEIGASFTTATGPITSLSPKRGYIDQHVEHKKGKDAVCTKTATVAPEYSSQPRY